MRILTDREIDTLDVSQCAKILRQYLVDEDKGIATSPPRLAADLVDDQIVFTSGGDAQLIGFRAYTYRAGLRHGKEDQIVACWDRAKHDLKGVAIGERLGAWRTGLLGGIARDVLCQPSYATCGIIGTGTQAWTQALATAAMNPPRRFRVFSRSAKNRERFALDLETKTGIKSEVIDEAQAVAEHCQVLIVATNSKAPVVQTEWLKECRHVSTVGPKSVSAHEMPTGISDWADILISDSPQQIKAQDSDHFLANRTKGCRIRHLGSIISNGFEKEVSNRTLYLSSGLAGTEVALLSEILKQRET